MIPPNKMKGYLALAALFVGLALLIMFLMGAGVQNVQRFQIVQGNYWSENEKNYTCTFKLDTFTGKAWIYTSGGFVEQDELNWKKKQP